MYKQYIAQRAIPINGCDAVVSWAMCLRSSTSPHYSSSIHVEEKHKRCLETSFCNVYLYNMSINTCVVYRLRKFPEFDEVTLIAYSAISVLSDCSLA